MPNLEITNNKTSGIVIWDPVHDDDVFTTTGAAVFAPGTVLGRLTANDKLTAYAAGASDGAETPVAVLPYEVEFTASGDQTIRPLISGRVRAGDLIEHGVGSITDKAVLDQLRDYSIIALGTTQLSELDNQ